MIKEEYEILENEKNFTNYAKKKEEKELMVQKQKLSDKTDIILEIKKKATYERDEILKSQNKINDKVRELENIVAKIRYDKNKLLDDYNDIKSDIQNLERTLNRKKTDSENYEIENNKYKDYTGISNKILELDGEINNIKKEQNMLRTDPKKNVIELKKLSSKILLVSGKKVELTRTLEKIGRVRDRTNDKLICDKEIIEIQKNIDLKYVEKNKNSDEDDKLEKELSINNDLLNKNRIASRNLNYNNKPILEKLEEQLKINPIIFREDKNNLIFGEQQITLNLSKDKIKKFIVYYILDIVHDFYKKNNNNCTICVSKENVEFLFITFRPIFFKSKSANEYNEFKDDVINDVLKYCRGNCNGDNVCSFCEHEENLFNTRNIKRTKDDEKGFYYYDTNCKSENIKVTPYSMFHAMELDKSLKGKDAKFNRIGSFECNFYSEEEKKIQFNSFDYIEKNYEPIFSVKDKLTKNMPIKANFSEFDSICKIYELQEKTPPRNGEDFNSLEGERRFDSIINSADPKNIKELNLFRKVFFCKFMKDICHIITCKVIANNLPNYKVILSTYDRIMRVIAKDIFDLDSNLCKF